MATDIGSPQRFFHMPRFQHQAPRQVFYKRPDFAQQQAMQQLTFDGKRMRKAVNRKTIDYNPSVIRYLENRLWQRDHRDFRAIQPDAGCYNDLVPPVGMLNNPMNAVTTKFVRTSTNKVKCPVFVIRWTPEGRRLVTGASSGEFTLWNGLTFNFETILQAHDSPVRAMTWSHNDMWMLTADHGGYVKYWQSNMNNVKMFQAHKEAIREARFLLISIFCSYRGLQCPTAATRGAASCCVCCGSLMTDVCVCCCSATVICCSYSTCCVIIKTLISGLVEEINKVLSGINKVTDLWFDRTVLWRRSIKCYQGSIKRIYTIRTAAGVNKALNCTCAPEHRALPTWSPTFPRLHLDSIPQTPHLQFAKQIGYLEQGDATVTSSRYR